MNGNVRITEEDTPFKKLADMLSSEAEANTISGLFHKNQHSDLPRRYTKKEGRVEHVNKLKDSNLIGLLINPDLEYDEKNRTAKTTDSDSPKVKNYVIFCPYGELGSKIFIHGKDIFTKDAAEKFFATKEKNISLFKRNSVERIQRVYLPETFEDRYGGYNLNKFDDPISAAKFSLEVMQDKHPEVDFSPIINSEEKDINKFISSMLSFLENNNFNISEMIDEAKSNSSRYKDIIKKKISEDVTKSVNSYLNEDSIIGTEIKAKKKFGEALKVYVASHNFDWEILENFKVAATKQSTNENLEDFLKSGAKMRAENTLLGLVKSMSNPYSQLFSKLEHSVARIIVDSVQPIVVEKILHDKTATIVTDENDLHPFANVFSEGISDANGKYNPCIPKSKDFNDFILLSDQHLSHEKLSWLSRHEFEHKIDLDNAIMFSVKFSDKIPSMINNDIENLGKVINFIQKVDNNSNYEDKKELLIIGRKRGLAEKIENIENLRDGLLKDLNHIKYRLSTFIPEYRNKFLHFGGAYEHETSQLIEIPAVLEELKGKFGRKFVDSVIPNMAKATDFYRNSILRSMDSSNENLARG